jgi:hypothetical protein
MLPFKLDMKSRRTGWGKRVNFGLKFSFYNPSYKKKETEWRKHQPTTLKNLKIVLLSFFHPRHR